MPTVLTHAVVPLAMGIGLGEKAISRRLLVAGIVASMLPDLDVLAFRLNVAYADQFGHRGASHSVVFALLVACALSFFSRRLGSTRLKTFLFAGASAISHGLLDTFTNGGNGVALLWPFSTDRFFSAWQVIEVSPLSLRRIFSAHGAEVMQSEFVWVWLPAAVMGLLLLLVRLRFQKKSPDISM